MIQGDAHFMEIKARNKNRSCSAQTSALLSIFFSCPAIVCSDNFFPFFSPPHFPSTYSSPPPPRLSSILLSPLLHPLLLFLSEHIRTPLTSDLNQNPPQSHPGVGNEVGRLEIGAPPTFFHSLNKRGGSFCAGEQRSKYFPDNPQVK